MVATPGSTVGEPANRRAAPNSLAAAKDVHSKKAPLAPLTPAGLAVPSEMVDRAGVNGFPRSPHDENSGSGARGGGAGGNGGSGASRSGTSSSGAGGSGGGGLENRSKAEHLFAVMRGGGRKTAGLSTPAGDGDVVDCSQLGMSNRSRRAPKGGDTVTKALNTTIRSKQCEPGCVCHAMTLSQMRDGAKDPSEHRILLSMGK